MYQTLDEVNRAISICSRCKTMNQGQKRVLGTGSVSPSICFVGEAPGRLGADQTGVPFTQDRSGELLRNAMKYVGLSLENDVYITNVVKCNPRDEHGRNRRPTREEIEKCREYLEAELRILKHKVIVPLGETAAREFVESGFHMKEINARIYHHRTYGSVFPLYHPGYIVRGNYSKALYMKDFHYLTELVHSPE